MLGTSTCGLVTTGGLRTVCRGTRCACSLQSCGQAEPYAGRVMLQREQPGHRVGLCHSQRGMGGSREAVDLFQISLSENTVCPSSDLC